MSFQDQTPHDQKPSSSDLSNVEVNHSEHEIAPTAANVPPKPRVPMALQWAIAAMILTAAAIGLGYTVSWANTGAEGETGRFPDTVVRVTPPEGASVPRQTSVSIQVAEAHDAFFVIDGVALRGPEDGVHKDLGTGVITFQPGPDTPFEELPQQNLCVYATVWDLREGLNSAATFPWCFTVY